MSKKILKNKKAIAQCSYLFDGTITGNAAVFCSDERFIDESISFLKYSLNINSFDLIVTAGGPAFINTDSGALMDNLKLLAQEHNIKRFILISHQDCKYYKKKYQNADDKVITASQLQDLRSAKIKLEKLFPGICTDTYFAFIEEGKILFKEISNS
jgi:carbonic anhydrase